MKTTLLIHKLESLLKKLNDIDTSYSKEDIIRIKIDMIHEVEDCLEIVKGEDSLE